MSSQNTSAEVSSFNLHYNLHNNLFLSWCQRLLGKGGSKINPTWQQQQQQKSFRPQASVPWPRPCLVFLTSVTPRSLDSGFSHVICARLWQVRTLWLKCPASIIHAGLWLSPATPWDVRCLPKWLWRWDRWTTLGHLCQGIFDQAPGRFPSRGFLWREEWPALSTPPAYPVSSFA